MPKDKKPDEDMLQPLRERYLTNLKKEIKSIRSLEKGKSLSDDERQTLIHIAHKFIGSGKTFGFSPITESGSLLHARLIAAPAAKDKDILPLLKNFLTACDEAGET